MSGLLAATIWTNTVSGLWQDSTNWASGNLPSLTSGIYITNLGVKTVSLDATTPLNRLAIGSLNIWAPTNGSNRVVLRDLGINRSLLVSNVTLDVRMRGALQITNSSLIVTSVFAGSGVSFNIWAGSVTLDSGSIVAREATSAASLDMVTRVGRTNIASLNINGGTMYSSTMQVGEAGVLNSRSHGTVRMSGGLLTVPGELSIGKSLNCTGVVDMVGGQIYVPNNLTNIVRVGDQGVGVMTISNALFSAGDISVGRHDTASGTVVVLKDGLVGTSDDFSIGRFGNSTGLVFMADGQLIVTNHPIWVGREGVGSLFISNGVVTASEIRLASDFTNTARGFVQIAGGKTTLSTAFTLGSSTFSTGNVAMAGGTLLVSNSQLTAVLQIPGGTFTLDGGNLAADTFVMTNDTGALIFNGGRFVTSGSSVANGQPFVIGDGTNAAVLELRGGTHTFADGLIISPNATLTGCGIIIGGVINNGTNSLNCDGPGLAPFILQQPANQTTTVGGSASYHVVAASGSPLTYQWLHDGSVLGGANTDTFNIASAVGGDAGGYIVVVSNDSGSTTSRVATLTLANSPVITTQPLSQSVAQNSPASMSVNAVGDAPLSFQWLRNSNAIAGATATNFTIPSAQPSDSAAYNVVVSNPFGVVTSAVATVLVLIPPAITMQPVSQNPASNSPVTFSVSATGSPTLLYQWRRGGSNIAGATDSMLVFGSAQLTNAGLYSVVVRNPAGAATSSVVSLTFLGPPIIIQQPASQTNARTSTVNFSVIASGTSPLSYQWRFNNGNISTATNSTYSRNNLGSGDAGNYTVVVTNNSGAITSQVAVLTVLSVVSISTQPSSQTATQGVTASLRVVAGGSSPFFYQWRFAPPGLGETSILGATNATLTFNSPQTNNAGAYRVVVSNPVSAITSQVATLTVLVPPAITQQPQSRGVSPGSNATFTVTATGSALTYRWRKNAAILPGATNSSFTVANAQPSDAGTYSVIVSNVIGSVTSSNAVLKVLVAPQPLNISWTNGTARVSFTSLNGSSYALEFKDHLEDAQWTSLATVPGNGGLLTLTNLNAAVPARFYRVRVE